MATIRLEISGGKRIGSYNIAKKVSDADAERILNAYGALIGPAFEDDRGERKSRVRTAEEVVTEMAEAMLGIIFANVESYERQRAAKVASDAVTPIAAIPA